MKGIAELLQSKTIEKKKMREIKSWQELALEIIKEIPDGEKCKGSIFKTCKQDQRRAQIAFNDCKELKKLYSKYYFKVFSELNKL